MSRFELNKRGLEEVAEFAVVEAARDALGRAIIERAGAVSPSHKFAETLEVLDTRKGPDGPIISVGTRWGIGHIIEWGSVNNPPYAPLRRAITGLRLKFEED